MISVSYSQKRDRNQRWKVKSSNPSYHRLKERAVKEARRQARKRNERVKVNNVDGSYYYIKRP